MIEDGCWETLGPSKCHLITPLLDDITSLVGMMFGHFKVKMQMQMSSDIISLTRMVMMANKMKLVNLVQWDLEVYIVLFWNR